jgi:hypothetical protein
MHTRSRRHTAALTLLSLLVAAAPVAAQTRATIPDQPSCNSCTITLRNIVQLGSDADPAGFGLIVQIAAAPGPVYFVSSPTFANQIFMYDAAGTFTKAIGRRGEGPGELSRTVNLSVGAGDTIHAIEMGSNRHHVITRKGVIVRSTMLRDPVSAFAAGRDGTLFAAARHVEGKSMTLLEQIAADGDVIASFEKAQPDVRTSGRHFVAIDPAGDRWSISAERLHITHWGKNNDPLVVLDGKRDWFVEGIPPQGKNPMQVKPVAWMGGLGFASGSLLVYYMVPDAKWAPMEGPPDLKRIYDTRIEAIDPATGALLAVKTLDEVYMPVERDMAYTMVEAESGDLRLQLTRIGISR